MLDKTVRTAEYDQSTPFAKKGAGSALTMKESEQSAASNGLSRDYFTTPTNSQNEQDGDVFVGAR